MVDADQLVQQRSARQQVVQGRILQPLHKVLIIIIIIVVVIIIIITLLLLLDQVGVLTSHVHSIVMSSNLMEGKLPAIISKLTFLRMIELATMPGNNSFKSC